MTPLDTFCDQTKARHENWAINSKAKMRLRCTIAASYGDDPGLSLNYLLSRNDNPIDLGDVVFDPIANFLTSFVNAVIPK
jgi:hypothetical protein